MSLKGLTGVSVKTLNKSKVFWVEIRNVNQQYREIREKLFVREKKTKSTFTYKILRVGQVHVTSIE